MAQSDNIFAYEGRHEKVSVVVSLLILSSALCVQPLLLYSSWNKLQGFWDLMFGYLSLFYVEDDLILKMDCREEKLEKDLRFKSLMYRLFSELKTVLLTKSLKVGSMLCFSHLESYREHL